MDENLKQFDSLKITDKSLNTKAKSKDLNNNNVIVNKTSIPINHSLPITLLNHQLQSLPEPSISQQLHSSKTIDKSLAMHKNTSNNSNNQVTKQISKSNAKSSAQKASQQSLMPEVTIKMSDSSLKKNNLNDENAAEETDNDDITTPFKTNNDMITLSVSNENDKSTDKKLRNKSIFKTIFCCFTSTTRNRSSNKSISNTVNSNNIANNSENKLNATTGSFVNANNNSITTSNGSNKNSADQNGLKVNHSNTNGKTSSNSISKNNIYSNNNNNHSNKLNNGSYLHVDNNNNSSSININITPVTNNNNANNGANNNNNIYSLQNDNIYPNEKPLLAPIHPSDAGKKCLIIDLDETLVHSSFKQVSNADFIVPVEIDGIVHQVYVLKRPHVDEFLKQMGQLYECVLFTASLAKYADPVADLLDKWGVFRSRLFREACVYYRGNYVKDLSRLGRDLNKVIIIDNSPASYIFHPDNAVSCTSWFDDSHDTELLDLIPHFERLASVDSVYSILKQNSLQSNSNNSSYQQQSLIYAQQQNTYEETATNQQVPSQQMHSIIYQQQQICTNNENSSNYNNSQETKNTSNSDSSSNNYNYLLNENKILLSIDLMMASKQQQLQQQQQK